MPFHGTYVDFLTGDLIFGWDQHRAFFSKKYAKQPGEKRYMEDYGIRLSSSTAFGGKVQTDHRNTTPSSTSRPRKPGRTTTRRRSARAGSGGRRGRA